MDIKLSLLIKNRMYHEGISLFLEKQASCKAIKRFNSVDEVFECFCAKQTRASTSVLLTDENSHPDLSNLKRLKKIHDHLKVVMVIYSANPSLVRQCMAIGIEGLITEQDSMQDLKTCIFAVESGHIYYPKHCFDEASAGSLRAALHDQDGFVEKRKDMLFRHTGMNESTNRRLSSSANITTEQNGLALSTSQQVNSSNKEFHKHLASSNEEALTSKQLTIVKLVEQGMSNKEIARTLNIEVCTVKNHVHRILERLQVKNRCEAASWFRSTPQYQHLQLN